MSEIALSGLPDEFNAALVEGRLLIQSCNSCGKPNMYPRHHCPFCQSPDLGWVAAQGEGVLHSYTVVRLVPPKAFESDLPYALAVVKLDEGVQLAVRLLADGDGGWDAYECDARVVFAPDRSRDTSRGPVAWFTLASGV